MNVNPGMCKTCPFRPGGDIKLAAKIQCRIGIEKSQLCHGTDNRTLCRGARDWQLMLLARLGLIEEPTDEAFNKASRKHGVEPNQQKPQPGKYG